MSAKFEVYQDKKKKWRFRLKTANGKIIAIGEDGACPELVEWRVSKNV